MNHKIYKFMPTAIKYEIDKLPFNDKVDKSILYDVVETIFNSENEKTFDNGFKVPFKKFEKNIPLSKHIIYKHINYLKENNIISSVEKYSDEIINENIRKNDATIYYLHNSLNNNFKLFIYQTYKEAFNSEKTNNVLDANLTKGLFDINVDLEPAIEYINNSDIPYNEKRKNAIELHKINNNIVEMTKGIYVKRIFTNITKLSGELHQFLYFGNKKIAEVDAKSSQLTLISFLTREVKSKLHELIDNSDVDVYEYILNKLKQEYKYANLLFEKQFYKIETIKLNRKELKPHIYAAIFSGFQNNTTVSKVIKELFGNVIDYISTKYGNKIVFESKETYKIYNTHFYILKSKIKSRLPEKLQNLEAEIYISAAKELNAKGISTVTKHDSLIVKKEDVDTVVGHLKKRYKMMGYNVKDHHLSIEFPNNNKISEKQSMQQIPFIDNETIINTLKDIYNKKDTENYKFKHKDGTIFEGLRSEFINKYNLNKGKISELIKGKRKSVNGWKIKN